MHLTKGILSLVLATAFLHVLAQPQSQPFSLGIKAGPNVTLAAYEDRDLQKQFSPLPIPGYFVGGFIKFPLKNEYAFTSEFAYTRKGRITRFNEDWTNRANYHFADISMALRKSFRVKLGKNIPAHYFFSVGPNISYWLKGAGKVSVNPGGSSKYEVVFNGVPDANFFRNYYNEVNRWLFGIDLGIGGDAPILKNQRVYAEARFTWGHTYMGRKNSSSYMEILGFEDNLRANFQTLSFVLTYALDFDLRNRKKGKSTKDKEIKRGRRR
ncbi:MAG: porin family protein [Bacteroidota bacterium]